jgi:hypothetical protein
MAKMLFFYEFALPLHHEFATLVATEVKIIFGADRF